MYDKMFCGQEKDTHTHTGRPAHAHARHALTPGGRRLRRAAGGPAPAPASETSL